MNPLCLLTKGRTFKDMADRSGAYKLLGNRGLPRFTPKRQPALPAASEPLQTSLFEQPPVAAKLIVAEAPKVDLPLEPVAPAQPASVPESPFAEKAATSAQSPSIGIWKKTTSRSKEWVKRLVPWPKGRPSPRTTVQTELALEKVTVLRNDLNEDDLEVVLVERKVGTGEKPLARISKMDMTGEAWLKLTAPFRKKNNEAAIDSPAEAKPAEELSARV